MQLVTQLLKRLIKKDCLHSVICEYRKCNRLGKGGLYSYSDFWAIIPKKAVCGGNSKKVIGFEKREYDVHTNTKAVHFSDK